MMLSPSVKKIRLILKHVLKHVGCSLDWLALHLKFGSVYI